jgi:hypothetical protein
LLTPTPLSTSAKVSSPCAAYSTSDGLTKIVESVGGAAIEAAAVRMVLVIYVIRTGDVKERACFNPSNSENLGSGYVAVTVRLSAPLQRDGNRRALRIEFDRKVKGSGKT